MGDVGDPLAHLEGIVQQSKDAVAPLYREAYNQPMVVTPEIEGIMATPAFREALPHAVRNIRNAQRDPVELGFRLHPDGSIEGTQTLTAEGFDQVARAMRDNGRAAMDKSGFRPMDTTDSVHINNRVRDLKTALGDQNPAYAEANARYADDMAQRDAFKDGQGLPGLTGHEVNAQARHMPENAQEAWSLGARSRLADAASQYGAKHPAANVAEHVRQAIGDDIKQEAIGQMMGNNGAVRRLGERLEGENQAHKMWREVYGNSQTAARQASDADLSAQLLSNPGNLAPKRLLARFADHLVSRAGKRHENAVKEHIARLVTEQDPQTYQDLIAAITERAERDANFRHLLDRSGILAAKEYGREILPEE
jgi:hypothetical protein